MQRKQLSSAQKIIQKLGSERFSQKPSVVITYLTKNKVPLKQVCLNNCNSASINLSSKELFQPALRVGADYFIITHIRPNGSLYPENEFTDIIATIEKIGHYLGLSLLDCILLSARDYFSFRENGLLYPLFTRETDKYAQAI